MVEVKTPWVELSREAPCTGRRDELLDFVVLRDEAPNRAATRRHLAACARCRAFVETLELELRYAGRPTFDHPAIASRRPTPTAPFDTRAFESWLNEELRWRTEMELADWLARAARTVHRLDSEVRTFSVVRDQFGDRISARQIGLQLHSQIRVLQSHVDPVMSRGARGITSAARIRMEFSNELDLVSRLGDCGSLQKRDRLDLVRSLLEESQKLAPGRCGLALLNEALLEWFDGDLAKVPDLLDNAATHASCGEERACAIKNMSILEFDRGNVRQALKLTDLVNSIDPRERSTRWMRMIWLYLMGRPDRADIERQRLTDSNELRTACEENPLFKVRRRIRFSAEVLEAPSRRCKSLEDYLGVAVYGPDHHAP